MAGCGKLYIHSCGFLNFTFTKGKHYISCDGFFDFN